MTENVQNKQQKPERAGFEYRKEKLIRKLIIVLVNIKNNKKRASHE